MFNEELKNEFIHKMTDSHTSISRGSKLFSLSCPYEEKFGKDLCEFTDEEMTEFFSNKGGMRRATRVESEYLINKYLAWAKQNGFNVVCSGVKYDENVLVQRYRDKVVFNPDHLNRYMDAVFGSVDDGTSGLVCRCYLWLAFCGVDIESAMRLDESNVDIKLMRVVVNGREVPLYAEAIDSFARLKPLTEFRVFHPNYPDKVIMVPRESGTRFLRGAKRSGISKAELDEKRFTLSAEVKRRTGTAVKKGIVTTRLNFSNVKLSGVFYRMSIREAMGIKPDFSAVAALDIEGKTFASNLSYNSSISRIRVAYTKDYELWKAAYELYKEDSRL